MFNSCPHPWPRPPWPAGAPDGARPRRGEARNGGLLGAEVPNPMALRARCPRRAGISNDDTLAMAQAVAL